jgi:ferric iron reductase protein FhuF
VTSQALTPATAQQVAAARMAADALGRYFRLADPTLDRQPGWRSAAALYELTTGEPATDEFTTGEPATGELATGELTTDELATGEPGTGPLDELLDSVAERLGGCERRVSASLFYQGYAARLLSPQLGGLVSSGCLLALPAGQLRYRTPASEMIQLGLPPSPGWCGPAEALLDRLLAQSFTVHLLPLATAIRARTPIAAALLQDNAASALINGLRLLGGDWRPRAAQALASQNLRGSGTLGPTDPGFVRRSCCLYYRTPAGGLCGDCPLA